ncbi:hypothetical protein BC826DRAFT_1003457 [Russula brevipes]|nr:hypothetical protein BC826DRAFT_1003457 [Russula brevipes]
MLKLSIVLRVQASNRESRRQAGRPQPALRQNLKHVVKKRSSKIWMDIQLRIWRPSLSTPMLSLFSAHHPAAQACPFCSIHPLPCTTTATHMMVMMPPRPILPSCCCVHSEYPLVPYDHHVGCGARSLGDNSEQWTLTRVVMPGGCGHGVVSGSTNWRIKMGPFLTRLGEWSHQIHAVMMESWVTRLHFPIRMRAMDAEPQWP